MRLIAIVEREMNASEFARMNAGFDEHTVSHDNPVTTPERHGFVATDGGIFVGCSSGLADRHGNAYGRWFYLTDLFVEAGYRRHGLGAKLLGALEDRVASLGIKAVWTWTAGYEAPAFYERQGYRRLGELDRYYPSGHARIAFSKTL